MSENSKKSFIDFAKAFGYGVVCFAAIITACGVWNGVALDAIDSFYGWVAGLNLIVEGFGFYALYKKLFPKKETKKVEEVKEETKEEVKEETEALKPKATRKKTTKKVVTE